MDATNKEMEKNWPHLRYWNLRNLHQLYVKASGYIIFDVKMDFMHKLRWVKDIHRTSDPDHNNNNNIHL